MLDDLEVHHHVHGGVGQGQVGEIPQVHLHARVAGADVRHRGFVVVHPDDLAGDTGDEVGAVPLPGAGLQNVETGAAPGEALVDDLVPAEPVILLGEAGDGAFTGQRQ